jgi:hypothetical protein
LRKSKFAWILATPQNSGLPETVSPVCSTKRAAAEPMLPSLMILIVPAASRLKRLMVLPFVSTKSPTSSVTLPRMSMIGSSVKPRPCSLTPPEISMKKTLPLAWPPWPLSFSVVMTWKLSVEFWPGLPSLSAQLAPVKATSPSPRRSRA